MKHRELPAKKSFTESTSQFRSSLHDHLLKLTALLEHKLEVLTELIQGQEQFKAFLSAPNWSQFHHLTQPQEELLNNLRQIQAAQDYLLAELSAKLNVPKIQNLMSLCRFLDPEFSKRIKALALQVGEKVRRLQALSRLASALNIAEWRFNRNWLSQCGQHLPPANLYNARGYVHTGSFSFSQVSNHV